MPVCVHVFIAILINVYRAPDSKQKVSKLWSNRVLCSVAGTTGFVSMGTVPRGSDVWILGPQLVQVLGYVQGAWLARGSISLGGGGGSGVGGGGLWGFKSLMPFPVYSLCLVLSVHNMNLQLLVCHLLWCYLIIVDPNPLEPIRNPNKSFY